jgi:hypothetical protein
MLRQTLSLALVSMCSLCGATPLLQRQPLDAWGEIASTWFSLLVPEAQLQREALFPGASPALPDHSLRLGVRSGATADGFRRLYVADQFGELHSAGLWLGNLDYHTNVADDIRSPDGFRRESTEEVSSSWGLTAWYTPKRNRIVKGFSLEGGGNRGSLYRAAADSILDVGWEQAALDADSSSAVVGCAVLFPGPRDGFIRFAVDLHGQFSSAQAWAVPAGSDSADWYTDTRHNSLRCDISCAYLRHNAPGQRSALLNMGIHAGGYRRFARGADSLEYRIAQGAEQMVDSVGGFVEGFYSKRIGGERWELFMGIAGLARLVYDYDTRADHDNWIEQLSNDRRTDEARAGLPLLARVHIGKAVYVFCAWTPWLCYTASRTTPNPGRTTMYENTEVRLDEAAVGLHWAASDRFQMTLVPALRDNVLFSSAEVLLRW